RWSAIPRPAVVAASALALACVAIPLPMSADPHDTATVTLRTVHTVPDETVLATVSVHPADLAENSQWFTITSWQGAGARDGGPAAAQAERLWHSAKGRAPPGEGGLTPTVLGRSHRGSVYCAFGLG